MSENFSMTAGGDAIVEALRGPIRIERANEAVRDRGEFDPVALPNDFELHDMEEFQAHRNRMRGVMRTTQVADFVSYTQAYAEGGCAVFVDPDDLSARAVLNLGETDMAGHADNVAALSLKLTPAYQALLQINSAGQMDQRKTAEWLEDWIDHIQFFGEPTYQEGGELLVTDAIKPGVALAAIRSMTVETARKVENEEKALGTARSAFESVQTSSKHTLPQRIVFTCRPADELSVRPFTVRIAVITGGDKPMLRFAIQRLGSHQAEMGGELVELIAKKCESEPLPIYLGSYKRGE